MTLTELNNLPLEDIFNELFKCCGSTAWANDLAVAKPFKNIKDLIAKSDNAWLKCTESDALEAFTHHPKIGDMKSLEKKFATKEWAAGEQSSVKQAKTETLIALASGNKDYENKFGYIFIVCATGKSAEEMLEILESRLKNNPGAELKMAMAEQNKITHLRLKKLIE